MGEVDDHKEITQINNKGMTRNNPHPKPSFHININLPALLSQNLVGIEEIEGV